MRVRIVANRVDVTLRVKSFKHACRIAAAIVDETDYRVDEDELYYFIRIAPCSTLATVSKQKVK